MLESLHDVRVIGCHGLDLVHHLGVGVVAAVVGREVSGGGGRGDRRGGDESSQGDGQAEAPHAEPHGETMKASISARG